MKITFITYHNWETKRQGGFHKFAEAAALAGHEVVFFSYPRPYYISFKHNERMNGKVLRILKKGTKYEVGKDSALINCTWPTLSVPGPLRHIIPQNILDSLEEKSLTSFKTFCDKFIAGTDCFVFESVGLPLYDKLKKHFPAAKFIYRPSDPVMLPTASLKAIELEKHFLLNCDKALIVNKQGVELYRRNILDFDNKVNYEIVSNGVDSAAYKLKYDCPDVLKRQNTALYMGAYPPNMDVVFYAAEKLRDVNFVIVCPEPLQEKDKLKLNNNNNVIYVPGVSPQNVPAWVTNAKLIMVPKPENVYKYKPWGILAKYYQAMVAGKPVVAYHDTEELQDYGISVTYAKEDFVKAISNHIHEGVVDYSFDSENMDWKVKTQKFLSIVNALCNR